ncbi:MAG: GNAT family N-acetyltransferase [Prevotella sp.]|nr:GNAT family N-acetyltransferase [Prevotella sp.]
MIEKKYLDWDSEFFHLKVAKIVTDSLAVNISEETKGLCEGDIDLVYIETPYVEGAEDNSDLGKAVDIKYIYEIRLHEHDAYGLDEHISICAEPEDELYALALQAGHRSRYRVDRNFAEGEFERLYRMWMDNSLNGTIADYVLAYRKDGIVKGMVTLKMKDDVSEIGLLAVDASMRGMGIGRKLMDAALHFTLKHRKTALHVATQRDNPGACRFYERCGGILISSTSIYHKWMR